MALRVTIWKAWLGNSELLKHTISTSVGLRTFPNAALSQYVLDKGLRSIAIYIYIYITVNLCRQKSSQSERLTITTRDVTPACCLNEADRWNDAFDMLQLREHLIFPQHCFWVRRKFDQKRLKISPKSHQYYTTANSVVTPQIHTTKRYILTQAAKQHCIFYLQVYMYQRKHAAWAGITGICWRWY